MPGLVELGLRCADRVRGLPLLALIIFALMCLMSSSLAFGQLSPGELHRSHAFLEGVENCNNCHSPDRKNLSEQCLACHTAIKKRQTSGSGLHAAPDYRQCELCHSEHHGRDFKLIYFKDGSKAFDHAKTGYILGGRHAQLACRQCHSRDHVTEPDKLAEQSVNLDSTYLGLSSACLSCHADQHREQLSDDCANCHWFDRWKPATRFAHEQTAYPLTGRHAQVACKQCHHQLAAGANTAEPPITQYRGIKHEQCGDCHKDAHAGRLGNRCTECHSTDGWQSVKAANFDHDRTRYPLRGLHASVKCEQCHNGRNPSQTQLRFAYCQDCHQDFHKGAFAGRRQGGACEECHSVSGFRPADFPLVRHDSTQYPLRGAHRAVPCDQCHRTTKTGRSGYVFTFASMRCLDCHRNPHRDQVDKWVAAAGCEGCHRVGAWNEVAFDHSKTDFPLAGNHRTTSCISCHHDDSKIAAGKVSFNKPARQCESCHHDIHEKQFAQSAHADGSGCDRCHTADGWRPVRFDHQRDARFALDGAHARVPCKSCHFKTAARADGSMYVLYRPLDTTCVSCHAKGSLTGKADS